MGLTLDMNSFSRPSFCLAIWSQKAISHEYFVCKLVACFTNPQRGLNNPIKKNKLFKTLKSQNYYDTCLFTHVQCEVFSAVAFAEFSFYIVYYVALGLSPITSMRLKKILIKLQPDLVTIQREQSLSSPFLMRHGVWALLSISRMKTNTLEVCRIPPNKIKNNLKKTSRNCTYKLFQRLCYCIWARKHTSLQTCHWFDAQLQYKRERSSSAAVRKKSQIERVFFSSTQCWGSRYKINYRYWAISYFIMSSECHTFKY